MKEKRIFKFKVSLYKDIYREIAISENSSLYKFAEIILKAFKFDMDHLFGFYDNLKNPYKSLEKYELFFDEGSGYADGAKDVSNTSVNEAFMLNKKMIFLFDYGDDWHFLVECTGISDPEPKVKYPKVLNIVGKPPRQYEHHE